MVIKVLSAHEMPPEQVESYRKFIAEELIDIQSNGLIEHNMSRVSTHLACLSELVGLLQAMARRAQPVFCRPWSTSSGRSASAPTAPWRKKAQADYVRAHTQLIQSWELYFAAADQKVPH